MRLSTRLKLILYLLLLFLFFSCKTVITSKYKRTEMVTFDDTIHKHPYSESYQIDIFEFKERKKLDLFN